MKAKLLQDRQGPTGPMPAGTIITDPQAYRLCELKIAEPADDECRARLGLPPARVVTCATAPAAPEIPNDKSQITNEPHNSDGVLHTGGP